MERAFITRPESAEFRNDRKNLWRRLPIQYAAKFQTQFPREEEESLSLSSRRPDNEDSSEDTGSEGNIETIVYLAEDSEEDIPRLEGSSSDEEEDVPADGRDKEDSLTLPENLETDSEEEMSTSEEAMTSENKIDGASKTIYEDEKEKIQKEIKEDNNRMTEEEKDELRKYEENEVVHDQKVDKIIDHRRKKSTKKMILKKKEVNGKFKDEFKNRFPEELEKRHNKLMDNPKAVEELIRKNTEEEGDGFEIFQERRSEKMIRINTERSEEFAEEIPESETYSDWSEMSEMITDEEIALSRENSATDLPRIPEAKMLILEYLIADSAQTTEIIGRLAAKDGHLNRSELRVMMVNMLKATERMGTITSWARSLYPDGNDGKF
ncbi:unnamed protein product [Oikopleura dioica]|uniref:Uncharacterized protein n=1 Tax=Oikopleura dioica TaxID=34765 RepID=E4XQC6_OIKDI|nr:unnamed protein product [Oikopleura dioica]